MYSLIRPLLFKLPPETAHHLMLSALFLMPQWLFKSPISMPPIHVLGLDFPHAIGLAAGLDKNGEYLDGLSKLGFSFIEVGTVTPKPQIGNPPPRLFRLPKACAIINRMGFNNHGVNTLITNIEKANYNGILGINIGKNKDTCLNNAASDYLYCLKKVYNHASYITINISSPNTPDLRLLQQRDFLTDLLGKLVDTQQRLADYHQRLVPLVVKVSPDESDDALMEMASIILKNKIAGIAATNTTADHSEVKTLVHGNEEGGLSGKPLTTRATHCIRLLKQTVGSDVALIGIGGIHDVHSANEKLDAGASLLQLYSSLVYQGPGLIPLLVNGIKNRYKDC